MSSTRSDTLDADIGSSERNTDSQKCYNIVAAPLGGSQPNEGAVAWEKEFTHVEKGRKLRLA